MKSTGASPTKRLFPPRTGNLKHSARFRLRPAAGFVSASPSGNPPALPSTGTAPNPTRYLLVMVLLYLVQVVALAVVTVLYAVFRWPVLFDAIVAVAVLMVAVALAMTVWVLRVRAR